MSQPASTQTAPRARAALFDLLLAEAPASAIVPYGQAAKPILVTFGVPSHEQLEAVALLGVRSATEDAGALGARRREESYELDVVVKVHHPAAGDDAESRKTFDARGFFLIEWVRSVVHRHWTLNGTVRTAFVDEWVTDAVQPADKGPGLTMFALLQVHCEAAVVDELAAP